MDLTPRDRVLKSLKGGYTNTVPFTVYENMIPPCAAERSLRNRGLCIVQRKVPVYKTHHPNVKIWNEEYYQGDVRFVRTHYETPMGNLSIMKEFPPGTIGRMVEKMFKSPDDYKAIEFLLKDEQYEENYKAFIQAEKDFGEDAIFRSSLGKEPLQTIISTTIMDMQDFCMEWMDRRDEILKLYAVNVENNRKVYSLVAESPVYHANCGGNVVAEITSPDMFEEYYLPHYHEACEAMHKKGKLAGCHFDGNMKSLAGLVASTELDYVESFTPWPDTDMTLREARDAWPGKVLWINFPSSYHLRNNEGVEAGAFDLLEELERIDGIIMGVSEDVPSDRWRKSYTAIMDGLERHSKTRPELYS